MTDQEWQNLLEAHAQRVIALSDLEQYRRKLDQRRHDLEQRKRQLQDRLDALAKLAEQTQSLMA